jgi:ABC-2 type transport system ATP-binding protein
LAIIAVQSGAAGVVGLNNELLKVDNLWAGYRKGTPFIRNLSFSLEPGEIVGLIGPNGAGKSTTLKVILGLIEKWQGQVLLPSIQDEGYSYIPELPALYDELTLWEHLEIGASLFVKQLL